MTLEVMKDVGVELDGRVTRSAHDVLLSTDSYASEKRGGCVIRRRAKARAAKLIRELRSLGYRIELTDLQSGSPA